MLSVKQMEETLINQITLIAQANLLLEYSNKVLSVLQRRLHVIVFNINRSLIIVLFILILNKGKLHFKLEPNLLVLLWVN